MFVKSVALLEFYLVCKIIQRAMATAAAAIVIIWFVCFFFRKNALNLQRTEIVYGIKVEHM